MSTNGKTQPADRTRHLESPLVWGLLGVFLTCIWLSIDKTGIAWREFPLDDGWIHLVYARGITDSGLPEYNPGTPQTGMSSLLWVLLNVPLHVIGEVMKIPPAILPKLLSAFFGGLCAWAVFQFKSKISPSWSLLPPILLLLNPHWLFSSSSGMEITLTALLWLLTLRSKTATWQALWCGLAIICRLESILLWGLILGQSIFSKSRTAYEIIGVISIPGLFLSAWCGYNYGVSGHFLPATFAVKAQTNSLFRPENIASFATYLTEHLGYVGLACIAFGTYNIRKYKSLQTYALTLSVTLLIMSVTHTLVQPEFFYWSRYLHHLIPLWILLSIPLLQNHARWALLLWLASNLTGLASVHKSFVQNTHDIFHMDTQVGMALQTDHNQKHWIAAMNAGSIRYHSQRPVIDIIGLNNHELAFSANRNQTLINQIEILAPRHLVVFSTPDAARLVQFLKMDLTSEIVRPNLSICDCPDQQLIGVFKSK